MPEEIAISVVLGKMLEEKLTVGKKYKITYGSRALGPGRHVATGVLSEVNVPDTFFDPGWLEIERKTSGQRISTPLIIRIQEVD